MKNLGIICAGGGIAALALAIVLRLADLKPLLSHPIPGLIKVCSLLLLAAIAIGVNKQ